MSKYQTGERLEGTRQNIALIKTFIAKDAKTAIDIGCNEGLITKAVAEMGLEATGYEAQRRFYDLAVKGPNPPNVRFVQQIVSSDDLDAMDDVDVAIFLSVHHQIVNKQSLEYANDFLIKLVKKADQVFFSPCAIYEKYGRNMPFPENDYEAMSAYFIGLVEAAAPGVAGKFIGISLNNIPKHEPYRPVIVFSKADNRASAPAPASTPLPKAERIMFNPALVTTVYSGFPRTEAGRVVSGDWAAKAKPITELFKYKACVAHWKDGVPWLQTGIFDFLVGIIQKHGSVDGCRNLEEVMRRYEQLDTIFEQVSKDRRLLSRAELNGKLTDERDGIFIHIGPQGELISGAGGIHRLSMAKILELPVAPGQIGCVHPDALNLLPSLAERPVETGSRRRSKIA